VNYGGTRIPPHLPKGCVSETLHLRLRAPYFYPDQRSQTGWIGGVTRKLETLERRREPLEIGRCYSVGEG
jgi:hypothetical protein